MLLVRERTEHSLLAHSLRTVISCCVVNRTCSVSVVVNAGLLFANDTVSPLKLSVARKENRLSQAFVLSSNANCTVARYKESDL